MPRRFFIRLGRCQVAVDERGFAFRAPVGLEGGDRFGVFRFIPSLY
jgi:hypothetical protein